MTALRFRCDNGEYSGQIVKRIGEMLIIEGLAQDSGLYFLQVNGAARRFDSRKEVDDYAAELANDAGFSPWDHDAGVGSYKAGRSINSNPNVVGTNEHASWEQGWNFAHRQAQELNPDKGVQDAEEGHEADPHPGYPVRPGQAHPPQLPQQGYFGTPRPGLERSRVGQLPIRLGPGKARDDKDDIERPINAAMQRRDPRLNYGRQKSDKDDDIERPINAAMQRRDPRLNYGRDYDAGFQLGQQHAGGGRDASANEYRAKAAEHQGKATEARRVGDLRTADSEQKLANQFEELARGGGGKDAPLSTKERQSGLIQRVMERMPGNPLKPPTQRELDRHAALAPRKPAPGQPYLDRPTAEEVKKAGW